jgi:hypothetical protein
MLSAFLPAAGNKCCGYLLQAAGRRLGRAVTGYHFLLEGPVGHRHP